MLLQAQHTEWSPRLVEVLLDPEWSVSGPYIAPASKTREESRHQRSIVMNIICQNCHWRKTQIAQARCWLSTQTTTKARAMTKPAIKPPQLEHHLVQAGGHEAPRTKGQAKAMAPLESAVPLPIAKQKRYGVNLKPNRQRRNMNTSGSMV